MGENTAKKLGSIGKRDCMSLPPDRFVLVEDNLDNVRRDFRGQEVADATCRNIFWFGIQSPIRAKMGGGKDKSGEELLIVVYGSKRVRAAKIANSWIKNPATAPDEAIKAEAVRRNSEKQYINVPFMLTRGDDLMLYKMSINENEVRTSSTPLQKARQMQRMFELGGTEYEAIVSFGCTLATIRNYKALLDCCGEVQNAVDAGKLSVMAAVDLSKLSEEEQRKALGEMIEAGNTKGYAAREAAQNAAAGKPAVVGQERVRLRSKKFLVKARDALREVRSDPDCEVAMNVLRFVLGEDKALRRLPEAIRETLRELQPKKKTDKAE